MRSTSATVESSLLEQRVVVRDEYIVTIAQVGALLETGPEFAGER